MKILKQGTKTFFEFVTKVHTIVDSLADIGEEVKDQDLMDIILEGLSEEYNSFVMMYYVKPDNTGLMELEPLLPVQEAQLGKFRQELTSPSPSAIAVQAIVQNSNPQANALTTSSIAYQNNNSYQNKNPSFVTETGLTMGEVVVGSEATLILTIILITHLLPLILDHLAKSLVSMDML